MTKNMLRGLDPATIIAIFAFVGGLGLIFNLLLDPVKAEQRELKQGQIRLEGKIISLEDKIDLLLKAEKSASSCKSAFLSAPERAESLFNERYEKIQNSGIEAILTHQN